MSDIPKWVMVSNGADSVKCTRCGAMEKVPLPMPISSFVKWCEYFGDKHKYCKPATVTRTEGDGSITPA